VKCELLDYDAGDAVCTTGYTFFLSAERLVLHLELKIMPLLTQSFAF